MILVHDFKDMKEIEELIDKIYEFMRNSGNFGQ